MKTIVLEGASVGRDMSWDFLGEFGEYEVHDFVKQEDVKEVIKKADIIIPNKLIIGEDVLAGSSVKLVCEAATGYNNIDIDYCKAHNIAVTNVGGYSTDSVAQHATALVLALCEKLSYYNDYVKSGTYSGSPLFGHVENYFHEISGKRWGIVGLGAIGKKTAEIATALGANVCYFSASGHTYDVPFARVEFDELLESCDIITIHCPLTDKTKYLFDKEAFGRMKNNAILVNVARGPVVNERDLVAALESGEIAAAGLDVFEKEPISADNPIASFKDNNRLIVTPHMAWGTVEARTRLLEKLKKNIESFIRGDKENRIV